MRAFLDGRGLLDVVETPVATGTVMERARSAGRRVLTVNDVSDETLLLFDGAADTKDDDGSSEQKREKLVKRSKQAFAALLSAIDDTLLVLMKDCMQGDANGLWERPHNAHQTPLAGAVLCQRTPSISPPSVNLRSPPRARRP